MLPKALKTCPKSNKSPNLVTLLSSSCKAVAAILFQNLLITVLVKNMFPVKFYILIWSEESQLLSLWYTKSIPVPEILGSNPVLRCLKMMPHLPPLFVYFQSFQTTTEFFTQNKFEKFPGNFLRAYFPSIWHNFAPTLAIFLLLGKISWS